MDKLKNTFQTILYVITKTKLILWNKLTSIEYKKFFNALFQITIVAFIIFILSIYAYTDFFESILIKLTPYYEKVTAISVNILETPLVEITFIFLLFLYPLYFLIKTLYYTIRYFSKTLFLLTIATTTLLFIDYTNYFINESNIKTLYIIILIIFSSLNLFISIIGRELCKKCLTFTTTTCYTELVDTLEEKMSYHPGSGEPSEYWTRTTKIYLISCQCQNCENTWDFEKKKITDSHREII